MRFSTGSVQNREILGMTLCIAEKLLTWENAGSKVSSSRMAATVSTGSKGKRKQVLRVTGATGGSGHDGPA